jgi:NAD(P)-dependent dehydrogenase (short-subunit alcohol dehydrogenase family)
MGALAGVVAGLAGTWAMNRAQRLWTERADGHAPDSAGGKHDAREWQERSEHQNANEIVAQRLAGALIGRALTRDELAVAAPAVHYAFGAAMGAVYGVYAERTRLHPLASGAAFGAAVWLAADEAAMPLLGLSEPPDARSLEMHGQALAAHLVYGATAALTRTVVRPARPSGGFTYRGRSVIITGGSRGLGLVMARQLVDAGAGVTLLARDQAELDRAAADLRTRDAAARVLTVRADVRRREDVDHAVKAAAQYHGRVDVVINNAGVIQTGPLDHMTLADFENAMNTHFWAPLHMTRAALPHLRRQRGGRIVNISSIGGRVAVPHMLPYSASKFALTGLSDGLRAELARERIMVTSVFPGLMRTGSPINATFKGRHEAEYAWFAVADSLPVLTTAAERAARQILNAARRGNAELVISLPAKLAILGRTLAPETFAAAMSATNQMLPLPTGTAGDTPKLGRDSQSRWAPSPLTASTDAAARRNNEL